MTDEQIDAVFDAMPGGALGFCKDFGYRQFARALLMEDEATVLTEVARERERQDGKWGGPLSDDARKSPADWVLDIEAYVTWACQMHRMGDQGKYRRRMMQVAALAVAACESYDRSKTPNVRAKRATTAWRAGQQAQNGPQAQRLMASATCRWRSA